jgi:hypothetical protein
MVTPQQLVGTTMPGVSADSQALASATTNIVNVAAVDPAALPDADINSSTDRVMYQRFLNRFCTKKWIGTSPTWWSASLVPKKRKDLWVDFFLAKGDVDQIEVKHKRHRVESMRTQLVYRPLTDADMMKRWHGDVDYVQKKKDDAVAKKRFRRDTLAPTDDTKIQYWVLDDESLSFEQLQELEASMQATCDVTSEDAMKLATTDGSMFSSLPMAIDGFAPSDLANVNSKFVETGTAAQKPPKAPPNSKPLKAVKEGEHAHKEGEPVPGAALTPQPPGTKARSMAKKLANEAGDACQTMIEPRTMEVSETLIEQITSAAQNLETQHHAVQSFIISKSECVHTWAQYEDVSNQILDYYSEKKTYAKSLGDVRKCREKQASDPATALAKEAVEAAAGGVPPRSARMSGP